MPNLAISKKIRIMAIYLPQGTELSREDLKRLRIASAVKSETFKNPNMKSYHELLDIIHSLTFLIDNTTTFKDIGNFIKERVPSNHDISELKGRHYEMLMKEQEDIKKTLGDNDSLKDLLNDQEEMQAMEENAHFLGKSMQLIVKDKEKAKDTSTSNKEDNKKSNEVKIGFKYFVVAQK